MKRPSRTTWILLGQVTLSRVLVSVNLPVEGIALVVWVDRAV